MNKIPQPLSPGEETLALHLRANNIEFRREACVIPGRLWRVDFLLPDMLVVEVEGGTRKDGRHQYHVGFEGDCAKYNAMVLAGYSILRYTTEQVQRGDAIRDIVSVVGAARTRKGTIQ